jgi:hypothetical protein
LCASAELVPLLVDAHMDGVRRARDAPPMEAKVDRRTALVTAAGGVLALTAPGRALARPSRSKVLQLPDALAVAARHDDPADLSAVECAALLQARLLSSRELTAACLARIGARTPG